MDKQHTRLLARIRRQKLYENSVLRLSACLALIEQFPRSTFEGALIAGYWSVHSELDVRPFMEGLADLGHDLALPVVTGPGQALMFKRWHPADDLIKGAFDIMEPAADCPIVWPDLILVPMLAFTASGARLGYGGGFYDRTLAQRRAQGQVFACGVAFSGQEMDHLPTDEQDQRLDGLLTEKYFKRF